MEFVNCTSFPALHYEAIDQHGGLFHAVVMRQSFRITSSELIQDVRQRPIRETDEYFDAQSRRSVRQESDLCPFKPMTDVIVNAVAHAPNGVASRRFQVRLRVESNGSDRGGADSGCAETRAPGAASAGRGAGTTPVRLIDKALVVTGERRVVKRLLLTRICAAALGLVTLGLVRVPRWRVTRPAPFMSLPMRYESAYGGENLIEARGADRAKQVRQIGEKFCLTAEQAAQHPLAAEGKVAPVAHVAHEENPVGIGFAMQWYLKHSRIKHLAAPRVEYPGRPFDAVAFSDAARGKTIAQPAGLGAVGRAWLPRRALIGAIEARSEWSEHEFPSLPPEFDHRYWNCAPIDQQCAHLRGDEFISLVNLSASGSTGSQRNESGDNVLRLQLPGIKPFLAVGDIDRRIGVKPCVLDTVYIDPEAGSVELVWRATVSSEANVAVIQLRVADGEGARTRLETLLRASARCDDANVEAAMGA